MITIRHIRTYRLHPTYHCIHTRARILIQNPQPAPLPRCLLSFLHRSLGRILLLYLRDFAACFFPPAHARAHTPFVHTHELYVHT